MMTLAQMKEAPDQVPETVQAEVLSIEQKKGRETGKLFIVIKLSDSTGELEASTFDMAKEKHPMQGSTHVFVLTKNGKYYNFQMGKEVGSKSETTQTPLPNSGAYSLAELARILRQCLTAFPANQSGDAQLAITLFIQATKCGIRMPAPRNPGEDVPF